ncbi:hypothetical protein ACFQ61_00540 [Streptomyces sp. NPDC056500]|uniref:hypothetical protein n=1 Tax=Streptomyces sp. NPDC056500 TaxID=3345840 RepID=UPI0036784A63
MSPTRFASEHKWIYIGAIVLLVGLAVVGVIQYNKVRVTNQATEKANQLASDLDDAGLPRPEIQTIERVLGTDGGVVCEDPASALKSALWRINLSNGAAGPGQRPIIADSQVVEAEAMIVDIYCPEKIDKIRDAIDDLKTDSTVRN